MSLNVLRVASTLNAFSCRHASFIAGSARITRTHNACTSGSRRFKFFILSISDPIELSLFNASLGTEIVLLATSSSSNRTFFLGFDGFLAFTAAAFIHSISDSSSSSSLSTSLSSLLDSMSLSDLTFRFSFINTGIRFSKRSRVYIF